MLLRAKVVAKEKILMTMLHHAHQHKTYIDGKPIIQSEEIVFKIVILNENH